MSTINFNTDAGNPLFSNFTGNSPETENLKASELLAFIKKLGLTYKNIKLTTRGSQVILDGEVEKQEDAEKIALAVGNVKSVASVDNNMTVTSAGRPAQYHTVASGETLSKIAGKYYGDVQKYNIIFEANKPMLTDPDKIYPGQVLRIPAVN